MHGKGVARCLNQMMQNWIFSEVFNCLNLMNQILQKWIFDV